MANIAFIVGSPRSGTTVLGEILDLHPKIAHWYEPYFVYDRHFRSASDDRRLASDATTGVRNDIRREVEIFQRANPGAIVIDKSPRNSLKLPFLQAIFPEAKFVHLLRDGRDVTLSLRKEWQRRRALVEAEGKSSKDRLDVFLKHLSRQPLLRHKVQAALFQIGNPLNLVTNQVSGVQAVNRWHGRVGFGPQFPNWEDVIDKIPEVAMNAMQWEACVNTILQDSEGMNSDKLLTVRYEDFLDQPQATLEKILNFLDLTLVSTVVDQMPEIKEGNYNKWEQSFTREEKQHIGPILQPLLQQLGYAEDERWYQGL